MNEHSFAKKIVSKCRPRVGIAWKINDTYAGGVPDAMFVGPSTTVWVEFKFTQALPKRDSTMVKPKLNRLQLKWAKDLLENNQYPLVVLGTPKEAFIFTSIADMENGISKKELLALTHNELVDLIVAICN